MQISVITVNLNNSEGLRKTLESVSAQTSRPEMIVIDGGSSDESVKTIRHYESIITHWVSEKDKGIYDAMNKGIAKAKGDYLLFLNSGDTLFEASTIASVIPKLKADIVYGNLKFDNGSLLTDGFMPDLIDLKHMLKDTLWHPASFIRAGLFKKYGAYDTAYRICGDYEFFFRTIIQHQVSTLHIHQFIAVYNLHGLSSDLSNHSAIIAEKLRVQEKYLGSGFRYPEEKTPSFFQKIMNRFKGWFQ